MVHNTIHATYTETYDLNTINGELSLLAVHTPQAPALKRMFKGFFEQYKKFKILGCNFKMVCASQQALDPTLVGMGAGQIDPRDVLNPILFKGCTGESLNTLLDQIYNKSEELFTSQFDIPASVAQHTDSSSSAIQAYYSLLADDTFRREHPQKGITVMGLKPMVHKVVTTQPFKWNSAVGDGGDVPRFNGAASPDNTNGVRGFAAQSGSNNPAIDPVNPSVFVSNGLTEMPWLDTAFSTVGSFSDSYSGEGTPGKTYHLCTNVPRVYMGILVLPPSMGAMNLYFRMQIVWHVAFRDFRPAIDLEPVVQAGLDQTDPDQDIKALGGAVAYYNYYHTSSKLTKDVGSLDTTGVENIDIVNEKVA